MIEVAVVMMTTETTMMIMLMIRVEGPGCDTSRAKGPANSHSSVIIAFTVRILNAIVLDTVAGQHAVSCTNCSTCVFRANMQ